VAAAPDTLNFDCADPVRVAAFWAGALGHEVVEPGPEGTFVRDPSGRSRGAFFQPVPEPKVVKNRVHLDLRPARTMADEVERLGGLGAQVLRVVEEHGTSWTVMGDVEGNEFCVLRGSGEGGRREVPGLDSIVVDSHDWRRAADFWCAMLGYGVHATGEHGIEIVGTRDGDPMLSFVQVPEPKTVKNRVHLDVRPEASMAAEVERVETLGATRRGFIEVEGNFWTQMRDPEGNEFCVLRGPGDGWSPDEL
jgi:predicted enzyme related to lactoylglutathione lyase